MKQQHRAAAQQQTDTAQQHQSVMHTTQWEDLDDLLSEIDIVLEENAEEFVQNYVQKGGQ